MASNNGREKAPAWVRRFGTELANALKATLLPELQEHTKLLSQHSAQLDRHEATLQGIISVLHEHSTILRQHGERLAGLEARTESLERTMEQGFRLLLDRVGDLCNRIVELAGQVRDNLELRDRVTRIEARLGLPSDS